MKPLSRLWHEFKVHGSQTARQELIERHVHLVPATACRVARGLPPCVESGDLLGAGYIGLLKAVDQFDPARGVQFVTYAITLIRGGILEWKRHNAGMPRLDYERSIALTTATEQLSGQLGRPPTTGELAATLGITEARLLRWQSWIRQREATTSLDLLRGEAEACLYDMVDAGDNVFEETAARLREETLRAAIGRLPVREAEVVRRYHFGGQTFKAIAGDMGCSESRVFQLNQQGLKRLRTWMGEWE